MARAKESWVRYLMAWLSLVALALLSLGLSSLHLGAAVIPISLGIAVVMATVALTFFMNLGDERFSVRIVPAAVLLFVALLVALTTLDVASRRTFPRGPAPSMGEPPAE
ncbi:MAG: hypothetical protein QM820_47770 [Minicystis sp.]